jgi:hypothetical protein
MELYLVKSSGQDEWGSEYWENLQIFSDPKLARNFAAKVKKLIRTNGDPKTEQVEIENFTLRTEEI